jgi:hypothetical protein
MAGEQPCQGRSANTLERGCGTLVGAIHEYVRNYNRNPQPFPWAASASRIIRKVNQYKETSETRD